MAGNVVPTLVQILIRLAADWWSIYGDRYWEMHRLLEPVRDLDDYPELKCEMENLDAEFNAHPFRPFVQDVSEATGLDCSELRDAARARFGGRRNLVVVLNEQDENGTTARLLAELYDRWPDDAVRLFGIRATAAGVSAQTTEPQASGAPASDKTIKTNGAAALETATGFLGGTELANVLGVHPSRRDAFLRKLDRKRNSFGDDWHEVSEPKPNSPRFLYRADSPRLREFAAAYKTPKLA